MSITIKITNIQRAEIILIAVAASVVEQHALAHMGVVVVAWH